MEPPEAHVYVIASLSLSLSLIVYNLEMENSDDAVDAFVVGAGPSGLFMALNLARYGLSVKIVDITKEDRYGRATGIHPRTLEIFDLTEVIDKFVELSASIGEWYAFKKGVMSNNMTPDC